MEKKFLHIKYYVFFLILMALIVFIKSCENINVVDVYLKVTDPYVEKGPFPSDTSIVIRARDFSSEEILKDVKITIITPAGRKMTKKTDTDGYAQFIFKSGIPEGDYNLNASCTKKKIDYFSNSSFHLSKSFNTVITIYLVKGKMER